MPVPRDSMAAPEERRAEARKEMMVEVLIVAVWELLLVVVREGGWMGRE